MENLQLNLVKDLIEKYSYLEGSIDENHLPIDDEDLLTIINLAQHGSPAADKILYNVFKPYMMLTLKFQLHFFYEEHGLKNGAAKGLFSSQEKYNFALASMWSDLWSKLSKAIYNAAMHYNLKDADKLPFLFCADAEIKNMLLKTFNDPVFYNRHLFSVSDTNKLTRPRYINLDNQHKAEVDEQGLKSVNDEYDDAEILKMRFDEIVKEEKARNLNIDKADLAINSDPERRKFKYITSFANNDQRIITFLHYYHKIPLKKVAEQFNMSEARAREIELYNLDVQKLWLKEAFRYIPKTYEELSDIQKKAWATASNRYTHLVKPQATLAEEYNKLEGQIYDRKLVALELINTILKDPEYADFKPEGASKKPKKLIDIFAMSDGKAKDTQIKNWIAGHGGEETMQEFLPCLTNTEQSIFRTYILNKPNGSEEDTANMIKKANGNGQSHFIYRIQYKFAGFEKRKLKSENFINNNGGLPWLMEKFYPTLNEGEQYFLIHFLMGYVHTPKELTTFYNTYDPEQKDLFRTYYFDIKEKLDKIFGRKKDMKTAKVPRLKLDDLYKLLRNSKDEEEKKNLRSSWLITHGGKENYLDFYNILFPEYKELMDIFIFDSYNGSANDLIKKKQAISHDERAEKFETIEKNFKKFNDRKQKMTELIENYGGEKWLREVFSQTLSEEERFFFEHSMLDYHTTTGDIEKLFKTHFNKNIAIADTNAVIIAKLDFCKQRKDYVDGLIETAGGVDNITFNVLPTLSEAEFIVLMDNTTNYFPAPIEDTAEKLGISPAEVLAIDERLRKLLTGMAKTAKQEDSTENINQKQS